MKMTKCVKQYKLIWAYSPDDLTKEVNKYLFDGWDLYEGPCQSKGDGSRVYAQAATKHVYVEV